MIICFSPCKIILQQPTLSRSTNWLSLPQSCPSSLVASWIEFCHFPGSTPKHCKWVMATMATILLTQGPKMCQVPRRCGSNWASMGQRTLWRSSFDSPSPRSFHSPSLKRYLQGKPTRIGRALLGNKKKHGRDRIPSNSEVDTNSCVVFP